MNADKLVDRDKSEWEKLIAATQTDDLGLDSDLVNCLLEDASYDEWFTFARDVIEECPDYSTTLGPMRSFESWFVHSALQRRDVSDASTWGLRAYKISNFPEEDGGYSEALELYEAQLDELERPELARTALQVADGALVAKEWDDARVYALRATGYFREAKDWRRANDAQRRLGAANLHLRKFERAFAIFSLSMETRAPIFGSGRVSFSTSFDDPFEQAISEAATISRWASSSTPEWIRAIGGMAERADSRTDAAELWGHFDEAIEAAFDEWNDPERSIEVIVRHSGERGLTETPLRALRVYVERWPDDEWAHRQIPTIEEFQRIESLIASLETEPDEAISGLMELFDKYDEAGVLGEDNRSIQVLEALLDHFIETEDRRAFDLQQRMYDAKIERYGQCPAAWLELQNIGSIHAEFGEFEKALELQKEAREHQVEYYGEGHPALAMTDRNIARTKQHLKN